MATEVIIKTWSCGACGYRQDFDPSDSAKMAVNFPGVPTNHCPACFMGQTGTREKKASVMVRETTTGKKIKAYVRDEADLSAARVLGSDGRMRPLNEQELLIERQKIARAHTSLALVKDV